MYGGYSLAVEQRVVVPLVRVQLPVATPSQNQTEKLLFSYVRLEKFFGSNSFLLFS